MKDHLKSQWDKAMEAVKEAFKEDIKNRSRRFIEGDFFTETTIITNGLYYWWHKHKSNRSKYKKQA